MWMTIRSYFDCSHVPIESLCIHTCMSFTFWKNSNLCLFKEVHKYGAIMHRCPLTKLFYVIFKSFQSWWALIMNSVLQKLPSWFDVCFFRKFCDPKKLSHPSELESVLNTLWTSKNPAPVNRTLCTAASLCSRSSQKPPTCGKNRSW